MQDFNPKPETDSVLFNAARYSTVALMRLARTIWVNYLRPIIKLELECNLLVISFDDCVFYKTKCKPTTETYHAIKSDLMPY